MDESVGNSKEVFQKRNQEKQNQTAPCPKGMHHLDCNGTFDSMVVVMAMSGVYHRSHNVVEHEQSQMNKVVEALTLIVASGMEHKCVLSEV